MGLKTMLYALTQVNIHLNLPRAATPEETQAVRALVAAAINDGATQLTSMGRKRTAATGEAKSGRPPSARFIVDTGNSVAEVLGGEAAAEAVNTQMAEWGMKERATAGNITVAISRTGMWFRVVATDNGDQTISVQRVKETA